MRLNSDDIMILSYETQISPAPIRLNNGTLIKPTLRRIAHITFDRFYYYEMLLKTSPKKYYEEFAIEDSKKYWDSLQEDIKETITLYELSLVDKELQESITEMLNFFFDETVVFMFASRTYLLKNAAGEAVGMIDQNSYPLIVDLIQQVCCIYDKDTTTEGKKFKNKLAEMLFNKIKKSDKQEKNRKTDINFSIPNIISAVSNNHSSISPINVWDLTIFQLFDTFSRLQQSAFFNIDCARVSVWGDEKNTFDAARWYKNEYDK